MRGAFFMRKTKRKSEYYVGDRSVKYDAESQLEQFQTEFENDKNHYDRTRFDHFERVYRGSGITKANRNAGGYASKQANVVRNITSELIESKVDVSVPTLKVDAAKPEMQDQAQMIQDKILSDMRQLHFNKEIDVNERNTYMHGIAVSVLNWNANLGAHEYIGEKELITYHPKQVIPQHNVYDIDKMTHIHLVSNMTKNQIKLEYGVDVKSGDYDAAFNSIDTIDGPGGADDGDVLTVVTRYYKDADGDIGKAVWCGSEVLSDLPKYYYPRVMHCKQCGYDNAQGVKKCKECGSTRLTHKVLTTMVVDEDLELEPLSKPQTRKEVRPGSDGQAAGIEEVTRNVIFQRTVKKGTEVPLPVPKMFPIAVRINVPYNFRFPGRSDVELINDLQESHKKVLHRTERKLLDSGGVVLLPKGLKKQITNDVYSVVEGKIAEINNARVLDTQTNIHSDLMYVRELYDQARQTIGITPSFQGQGDPSALSGRAKQIQISQASNILQTPTRNKYRYYQRIFQLMFYFDLCFSQEERPYVVKDATGKTAHREYNRLELLREDAAGQWYFCTDFLFEAERGSEIPTDKHFLYQEITRMAQSQMIDQTQFWQILSAIDFPTARQIYEKLVAAKVDPTEAVLGTLQGLLQQNGPDSIVQFLEAPLDKQVALIQQITQEGAKP